MITLGLDTATPEPSVAVVRDETVLAERDVPADAGGGRRVAEEVHLALADARVDVGDLERIVVGVGPGGFTGLRIGIATALALGQALTVPVTGVCSLETLALGMAPGAGGAILLPVIDARRREVFTAAYAFDGGELRTIVPPRAADDDAVLAMLAELGGSAALAAGDGLQRVAELLPPHVRPLPAGAAHRPRAVHAIQRADRGGARPVTPIYLRLPDAEVNRRLRERRQT